MKGAGEGSELLLEDSRLVDYRVIVSLQCNVQHRGNSVSTLM